MYPLQIDRKLCSASPLIQDEARSAAIFWSIIDHCGIREERKYDEVSTDSKRVCKEARDITFVHMSLAKASYMAFFTIKWAKVYNSAQYQSQKCMVDRLLSEFCYISYIKAVVLTRKKYTKDIRVT